MPQPPDGTVTFLFTDIEGSTQLWERHPVEMAAALQRHDALLRTAIEGHGGYVFKTVGDSFYATFPDALAALDAALEIQRALRDQPWATLFHDPRSAVQVRTALHTGTAQRRGDDYFGPPLNRAARLVVAGHGQQILLSLATCEMVRDALPAGVDLRDLGERRLRDLTTTERIYQVIAPDLPSEFPPLKTLDARPNNLPAQATPLIGREKELAAALALLRRPHVRVVTFTGPGGTGKTHLALQTAADLLDDFENGVYFVDLAPIKDPSLVLSTVARALGLKEAAQASGIADTLRAYLADKQLLLLADNFEQVVSAAPQLSDLLRTTPMLKLLATSRMALRLYGEHEFAVPPLGLPEPGPALSLAGIGKSDAVRLFVERAQAIKSDFDLNEQNGSDISEICRHLDGLPLAIELAAARVRILPPRALLFRLEHRLALLVGGDRDLPARQQSLRAAIEWSYDLLDDADRKLFARMSVFNGGRTFEALEAVCNFDKWMPGDMLDAVSSLVEKSLLQHRVGRDGEPRFWMLETIHEYAREKLRESGEAAELRKRHALYFIALSEETSISLQGPDQVRGLARFEDEHDNLRTALQWAKEIAEGADGAPDPLPSLRMGAALWRFWYMHGHYSEGRRWIGSMLPLPGLSDGPLTPELAEAYAGAVAGAGVLALQQGDYSVALARFREAGALHRQLGNRRLLASDLYNEGAVLSHVGESPAARVRYEESLAIMQELGDRQRMQFILTGLAIAASEERDFARAMSLFEDALRIQREIGDTWLTSTGLNNVACTAILLEDYEAASRYQHECLALQRELGNEQEQANSLVNLAVIAGHRRELNEAWHLCTESLDYRLRTGERPGVAECYETLAWIISRRVAETSIAGTDVGALKQAARLWGAAAALRDEAGAALPPEQRPLHEAGIAIVQPLLSEAAFAQAEQEGRALTGEQIGDLLSGRLLAISTAG